MTTIRRRLIVALLSMAVLVLLLSSPGSAAIVDDAKQMPGSACRFVACSFIPQNISVLQQLLMPAGTHQLSASGMTSLNDTCDVVCPIVRDDVSLPTKTAFVYAGFTTVTGGQNRRMSCHVENTTGLYFDGSFHFGNSSQNGPTVTVAPSTDIQVISLSTATTPPSPGSYDHGTSVIVCTVPPYSNIQEYGWTDTGGDSTDW